MPIRSYVQRDVQMIEPDATAREAAQQMERTNVGCLIVVSEGKPRGLVTDRDIALKVLCERLDPGSVRVGDLVGGKPVLLGEEASIQEAVAQFRAHRIRRLPVVDDHGKVIGLVTTDDLLMLLSNELQALSDAVQAQLPAVST